MPKVSIYIASRNYGRYLGEAIESVLRQTYREWELLIIDDGSTDNTAEVINLYKSDPRIKNYQTNGSGLTAVCNFALKHASGEYISRLDGDDYLDENFLLVMVNFLESNPSHALVFPDYYLIDEEGEIFSHERRKKISEQNHLMDLPANGACTLIRKSILEEIGGYREDLGAQDGFDLWSKVIKKYKCGNIGLPLFYYRRHGSNLTNDSGRIFAARRQIKRDAINELLPAHRPIIAVLPARQRYDFCEDLWSQNLSGKSLLELGIEKCLSSELFDYIIVACDNKKAESILKSYSDKRLHFYLRSPEDTIRTRSIVSVLENIAYKYDPERTGITVLTYLQAPFVQVSTLEEAIYTLIMNNTDSAIGVEEVKSHLLRRSPFGLQSINPPKQLRSDFDLVYAESNTTTAMKNKNFFSGSLTGPTISNFLVHHDECFFINSLMNLKIANLLAREEHPL